MSSGGVCNGTDKYECSAGPHDGASLAAIDGDAEQERYGFADGQDEGHGEGRHAACEPVDANDAQQLRDRVGDEVEPQRGHGRVHDGERDGWAGAQACELRRDAAARKVKEGECERVVVKHAFPPRGLCAGAVCGLDVPGVDVVLGEPEEAGEEEGEAEDGDALGVAGCGGVGVGGVLVRGGEGGEDDADGDCEYGKDLSRGISGAGERGGLGEGRRTVF